MLFRSNNLMEIYSAVTGKTLEQIEMEFAGKGYGDFKTAVGEAVATTLDPIQQKLKCLLDDKAQLMQLMQQGAERAQYVAGRTLAKAQKKMGYVML